jgi:hypothetical protein
MDDDDDDGFGPFLENTSTSSGTKRMPVMTPDVKVTTSGTQAGTTKSKSRKSAGAGAKDEEDEWNW